MAERCYAECHLCRVSFMLSVDMLYAITLSVVMIKMVASARASR
jgi:hypothetical protein